MHPTLLFFLLTFPCRAVTLKQWLAHRQTQGRRDPGLGLDCKRYPLAWGNDNGQCQSKEKLVFLHIPKTAGTSVEDAGYEHGVRWGRCMDFDGCDMEKKNKCFSPWHQPPAKILSSNMYTDSRVFCIVRHPFSRAVSEFQNEVLQTKKLPWRRTLTPGWKGWRCSPTDLNQFLKQAMEDFKASPAKENMYDCHLIPQSHYIWGAPNAEGQRRQWCHEIIYMEDLPQAFDNLMERFNYSVSLPKHAVNPGACPHLSTADLSDEVVELLTDVYKDDFSMLAYDPDIMNH